jgi:hypothetical protein
MNKRVDFTLKEISISEDKVSYKGTESISGADKVPYQNKVSNTVHCRPVSDELQETFDSFNVFAAQILEDYILQYAMSDFSRKNEIFDLIKAEWPAHQQELINRYTVKTIKITGSGIIISGSRTNYRGDINPFHTGEIELAVSEYGIEEEIIEKLNILIGLIKSYIYDEEEKYSEIDL